MANTKRTLLAELAIIERRTDEEIMEAGSIEAAIRNVTRQLAAPECQPDERRFMTRVLKNLNDRVD